MTDGGVGGGCLRGGRDWEGSRSCALYPWKMSFQRRAEDRRGSMDSVCVVICREPGGREGGLAPGWSLLGRCLVLLCLHQEKGMGRSGRIQQRGFIQLIREGFQKESELMARLRDVPMDGDSRSPAVTTGTAGRLFGPTYKYLQEQDFDSGPLVLQTEG